ncbi:MAG: hemerythrin domain-containing protein [Rhodobacteraceae bacterium]|nr:hemerythrin domain-containing protein [Paracoccaceae bacterium]
MSEQAPIHDAAELTRYIETRYHDRHRQQLPALAEISARVEMVHADHPSVPAGLAEMLTHMLGAMEAHMRKEEMILFPAIRAGGRPGLEHPIAVMRADHDNHEKEMADIRRLTNGPKLPEDACGSWTRLYAGLDEFMDDLQAHMDLENNVLFPQFEPARQANA